MDQHCKDFKENEQEEEEEEENSHEQDPPTIIEDFPKEPPQRESPIKFEIMTKMTFNPSTFAMYIPTS